MEKTRVLFDEETVCVVLKGDMMRFRVVGGVPLCPTTPKPV